MSTSETVSKSPELESIKLKEMLFKFQMEDGKKPTLSENSQIMVVVNGTLTNLELTKLFKGEKFQLDVSDADIKGYSALEFMDVAKSEIGLSVEGQ